MKAFTFVSMMLLAISSATAYSAKSEPVDTATAASATAEQAGLTTQRICLRCRTDG